MPPRVFTVFLLFLLVFGVQANAQPDKTKKEANSQQPAPPATAVGPKQSNSTSLEGEHGNHANTEVRIVSPPAKDRWDKASVITSVTLALVGFGGIIVALITLRKIERQTAATEKQAKHMVDSERPFLLAYTKGAQIWLKNCGKSPAQLIALSPFNPIYPEFTQEANGWPMPIPPKYGKYFDDAWMQLNIGWLGPGERRRFHTFDPTLRPSFDPATKFFMYGAVKYRGIYAIETKPFETRFCFTCSGDPLAGTFQVFMGGDYGYNQNT